MDSSQATSPAPVLVGESEAALALNEAVDRVADSRRLLIEGRPGSGQADLARWIHRRVEGAFSPFVEVDGARPKSCDDLFEAPAAATVCLRHPDRLPLDDQRALAARVAAEQPEARLIAILELEDPVAGRTELDPDLEYLLGVATLEVPELAERVEDLPALASALLAVAALDYGHPQPELAPEAVDLLPVLSETYQLEGLELQLRMALLRAGGRRIEARDLTSTSEPAPLGRTLASVEREHVEAVLVATGNNRAQAARELGINRSTLYNKLRDWNGGA